MLLASGVTALMTGVVSPGAAFLEWGWRVPFLLSIVLIVVGYMVRRAVDESPVFQEIATKKQQTKVPVVELFRKHWLLVILAALVFAGNNAAGYMATGGFIPSYATDPVGHGPHGCSCGRRLRRGHVVPLHASLRLPLGQDRPQAHLPDRLRLPGSLVFPLFWLINTGSLPMLYLALRLFAVGLGLSYGPQAAWYWELFPASVRFSGVSISYAIGAILGGAFAPTIAHALVQTGGSSAGGPVPARHDAGSRCRPFPGATGRH